MRVIKYNKLVRDRIPEMIRETGKSCVTGVLSEEEYLWMVDAKLDEELAEYHKDKSVEELADLIEVIYAAAKARGCSVEELEAIRLEKARKRGVFEHRILLKSVTEPKESDDLVSFILENEAEILAQFDSKMMEVYRWLREELYRRNVAEDPEYKRKFSGYYKMRFVTQEYRDAFFELFEELKNQEKIEFREVARALYEMNHKHEFSFISKMLHTIDPVRPIFDSQVCKVLHLPREYYTSLEEKILQDEQCMRDIVAAYDEMDASEGIQKMIVKMERFTQGYPMTKEKKYDFILWALGGVRMRKG